MKRKKSRWVLPARAKKHHLNTTITELSEPGDLYDKLLSVPHIKHNTVYKDLSQEELWNQSDEGEAWDNPVEALKEVITRELETENPEVYYAASLYIYRWIAGDERFNKLFTEEQYWRAKDFYNIAEANLNYSHK